MPYYKTVEEMLKGIGKTSSMSINRDISQSRYDAVKEIAAGTYNYAPSVPTIPISPYERPREQELVDIYSQSSQSQNKQQDYLDYQQNKLFEKQRPTTAQYLSERFKQSAVQQGRATLSIPQSMVAFGTSLWEKISGITSAETNAAAEALTKAYEAKGYKKPTVAPVTKAIESLKATQLKSENKIANYEASGTVNKNLKFAGDIVTVPAQQVGFAIEAATGIPVGTLSVFSSYVNGELDKGGKSNEVLSGGVKGIVSGQIEKRFFNLFKFLTPAGKTATGFLNKIATKAVPKSVMASPIFSAVAKLTEAGFGEGVEEWVNTYTDALADWRIVNPTAPIGEYINKQTFNEANYSALVGAASGAILGSAQFLRGNKNTTDEKVVSSLTQDVAEIPIGEIESPENVEKIEVLNHVLAGVQADSTKSVTSLVDEYYGTSSEQRLDDSLPSVQQIIEDLKTRNEAPQQTHEAPVQAEPIAEPVVAQEAPVETVEAPTQNVAKLAVSQYGITTDYKEAGYVMPDGKMLDFSEKNNGGEPGQRSMDHRDVSGFYAGMNQTEAMNQFIADTGAVRIGVNENNAFADIILDKLPTDKQLQQITRALAKNDSVVIDIYNSSKDNVPVKSIVLDMPLASKIMGEIKDAIKQTPAPASQPIPKKANKQEVKTEAKLVRVEWRSKIGDAYDENEGIVSKRISDWDQMAESEMSGRNIVHVYWIEENGETKPYGKISAAKKLGMDITKFSKEVSIAEQKATLRERGVDSVKSIVNGKTFNSINDMAIHSWRTTAPKMFEQAYVFEKDGQYINIPKSFESKDDSALFIDVKEYAEKQGFKEITPSEPVKAPVTPKKPVSKEKPKVAEERATRPATITMKVMEEKHRSGQDVSADMDAWVDTEEGQKLVGKIKTKKDLAEAVQTLKYDIQGSKVINKDAISGGYLQLLAYKSWAKRIKDVPEGSRISLYMQHMAEAMKYGTDSKTERKIEQSVKDSDLFHQIVTDDEVIMQAEKDWAEKGESYAEQVSKKIGTKGYQIKESDVVLISMYAKKLMEDAADTGNYLKGVNALRNLSMVMTQSGRFIHAADIAYKTLFPEYYANAMQHAFNKFVEPQDAVNLDNKVEVTADVARKSRKEVANDVAKDVQKDVTRENTKEEQNPLTAAQKLAKMIEASVKEVKAKTITEEQKMLNRLMTKYNDVAVAKGKKPKVNPFDVLTDIVANRTEYAEVWNEAKDILGKIKTGDTHQSILNFLDAFADPVAADKFMSAVVRANIKSMDKTIAEYAREYFFNGDEAISGFYEKLAENMPNLGESGLQYVEQYLAPIFRAKMINQRDVVKKALRKQVARRSVLKKEMDIQELLINKLTDATYRDSLNIPELRDLWAARLGVAHLDQESIADIYQTMRDMYNMKTQEEKDTAYDALAARLAKRIPATTLDKYIAFTRTAMLLNPPTWIRNLLSNVTAKPMYRASDVLSNTLQRMMKVPQADRMAGKAVTGFKANSDIGKAILSRTQPSHMERVMRHTNKYAMAQLMGMERRIFKTNFIEKVSKIPGRVMNEGDILGLKNTLFGDRRMFTNHYRYAMANRMTALGYSETMTEDQKAKILEDAKTYASEYATVRTYRAKSIISQMINNLGKKIHSAKDIRSATPARAAQMVSENNIIKLLMKINVPFVNTPAAIVTEVYRFSPYKLAVSLVKAGVFTAQGKMAEPSYRIQIANEFSQAAVGTLATFIPGIILGMFGFLTGAPPENDKEKEMWELQGKRAYSIYIPGVGSYSIDWLQPLAPGLMMGAALAQSIGENDGLLTMLDKVSTATLDAMLANSIIDSLQRNLGAGYKTSLEKVRDIVLSGIYQMMPGILARFNRILDPYVRDTYSGGAAQQLFNRLMGTIPFAVLFAPEAVPIKTDIWGRKVTQAHGKGVLGVAERAVLNMLSPFIQTKASTDGVTQEVIRVWEKTNTTLGNKAIPSAPSNKIDATTKHPEYVLSTEEYALYVEKVGSLYYTGIKKKMASDGYYNLTPEEKAKAFDKIYREAREAAKETYIKSKGGKP